MRGHGHVAGRPVGFLVAWLLEGSSCDSKVQHWDKEMWARNLTLEARRAARAEVLSKTGGARAHESRTPTGSWRARGARVPRRSWCRSVLDSCHGDAFAQ